MSQAVAQLLERDWQQRVVDLAKMLGYRIAHFRPAHTSKGWRTPMTGHPGFPDLVICGRGRLIFAELKAEKGKAAPEQVEWLQALGSVPGVYAAVWKPSDWPKVVSLLSAPERGGQLPRPEL